MFNIFNVALNLFKGTYWAINWCHLNEIFQSESAGKGNQRLLYLSKIYILILFMKPCSESLEYLDLRSDYVCRRSPKSFPQYNWDLERRASMKGGCRWNDKYISIKELTNTIQIWSNQMYIYLALDCCFVDSVYIIFWYIIAF